MKWFVAEEVERMLTSREFVDTALVPVYSLDFSDLKEQTGRAKTLERIVSELESQLTGRLFLLPPVTIYGEAPTLEWIQSMYAKHLQDHFTYQVYIGLLPEDKDAIILREDSVLWLQLPLTDRAEQDAYRTVLKMWG